MRNPDLEQAVASAPDDVDSLAVYSDWLTERGEPHGALIALHLRRRATPSAVPPTTELVEEARLTQTVFADVKRLQLPSLGYTIGIGFLDALRIGGGGKRAGEVLREILAHRTAAFLRSIEVVTQPRMNARWYKPSAEDLDEKATTASVWATIVDVGFPRTLRSATLPPPLGADVSAEMRRLAGVEELAWPLRSVGMLDRYAENLERLRSLVLSASHLEMGVAGLTQVLAAAPMLAKLPEVTLEFGRHVTVRAEDRAVLVERFPNLRITYT